MFLQEVSNILDKALTISENIILMGDFNIDINSNLDKNNTKLINFCDNFSLRNLINEKTCITKNHQSQIDLFLTNKPRSFHNSSAYETGISDHHKIICSFLKTNFVRLKPKTIYFRKTKHFNKDLFIKDTQSILNNLDERDANISYDNLTKSFLNVLNKYAPIKQKTIRGNHAPFMNKHLSKEIYIRSKLKNTFQKFPTTENWEIYKKQRNKCVNLRKKSIKMFFKDKIPQCTSSKLFWKTIKPFLTNKGFIENNKITLLNGETVIDNDQNISEIFNNHYINIVEKSGKIKPNPLSASSNNSKLLVRIKNSFKNHESILRIKSSVGTSNENFSINTIVCYNCLCGITLSAPVELRNAT